MKTGANGAGRDAQDRCGLFVRQSAQRHELDGFSFGSRELLERAFEIEGIERIVHRRRGGLWYGEDRALVGLSTRRASSIDDPPPQNCKEPRSKARRIPQSRQASKRIDPRILASIGCGGVVEFQRPSVGSQLTVPSIGELVVSPSMAELSADDQQLVGGSHGTRHVMKESVCEPEKFAGISPGAEKGSPPRLRMALRHVRWGRIRPPAGPAPFGRASIGSRAEAVLGSICSREAVKP